MSATTNNVRIILQRVNVNMTNIIPYLPPPPVVTEPTVILTMEGLKYVMEKTIRDYERAKKRMELEKENQIVLQGEPNSTEGEDIEVITIDDDDDVEVITIDD